MDEASILAALFSSTEWKTLAAAIAGRMDHDVTTGQDRVLGADEAVLATLSVAQEVAFTAANWTNATKYLIKSGAFAGYLWKSGDVLTLSAGTGVTVGQYTIAAKIDDDTLELATDINGAGGDISDNTIAGTIDNGRLMRTVA